MVCVRISMKICVTKCDGTPGDPALAYGPKKSQVRVGFYEERLLYFTAHQGGLNMNNGCTFTIEREEEEGPTQ